MFGQDTLIEIFILFAADIDTTVNIIGQKIMKDGEIYFNIKDFFIDFNIGHATIELENLFNGDKELGE